MSPDWMGSYSMLYSSPSSCTWDGSICGNKSILQQKHVTRSSFSAHTRDWLNSTMGINSSLAIVSARLLPSDTQTLSFHSDAYQARPFLLWHFPEWFTHFRGCLQRVSFRPFHYSWADSSRALSLCSIALRLGATEKAEEGVGNPGSPALQSSSRMPQAAQQWAMQTSPQLGIPTGQSPTSASHCRYGHNTPPVPKLLVFHLSGPDMFFPAFSPPRSQLIDSSSWSLCCLSPSDGWAAVVSRERANELLLSFFSPSVSSEVTLRANGVSQLVWFIWFNVPPWPLGLAWPFIQAPWGPEAT